MFLNGAGSPQPSHSPSALRLTYSLTPVERVYSCVGSAGVSVVAGFSLVSRCGFSFRFFRSASADDCASRSVED